METVVEDNRMLAAQVSALFENVTLGTIGAALGAAVLSAALFRLGAIDGIVAASWTSYIVGCATLHNLLRWRFTQLAEHDVNWRAWAALFTFISLLEGIGWGWGSVNLSGHSTHFADQMLIMVVTLSIAGGAIPAFGSYLPAFFALFLPATVPTLFWSVAARDLFPEATPMLLLMLIFTTAMGGLGVRANWAFKELVNLRLRTIELADDLRKQKDVAEQASLAKSTFLAAASHDLRQPVHALGLFVGALRALDLPPEGVRLVGRIEESTNAMDSLFSAILDISKLDAGVVHVHPQSFPIQSVINRICADYLQEAQSKSIALVRCPCSLIVRTDPLLLERVLRNLISNAVRYTQAGRRVLIGCRRRGPSVSVEVWDTGPGVAFADRERIFQEYFQLQNPERDRAMGLGLGLAIVRRLTDLLGCPVALRSQLGRGSCFSVAVPRSESASSARSPDPILASVPKGLVLVVDDEKAIQDAMESLLTGWGYSVITAGSGAEMKAKLADCSEFPEVIICDYRLRAEENGINVIQELRSEFNEAIPAMLITGDTAPDRLIEAQDSGLLLLHKPVPNAKLRAAIVNLTARVQADA